MFSSKPAHYGGCNKIFERDVANFKKLETAKEIVFIGRLDLDEDGDQRLSLFNCTCCAPGTFAIEGWVST